MGREEREQLGELVAEALRLSGRANEIVGRREAAESAVTDGVARLAARSTYVEREGRAAWRVLAVTQEDVGLPADLAVVRDLAALTDADARVLQWLRVRVGDVARQAAPLAKARFFRGRKKLEPAHVAAGELSDLIEQTRLRSVQPVLDRLDQPPADRPELSVDELLESSLDFGGWLGVSPGSMTLVPRDRFNRLAAAISVLDRAVAEERRQIDAATSAGEQVRAMDVRSLIEAMPVEALKPMTREQLTLKPLIAAGITSVQTVLDRASTLERIPGMGRTTARRAIGAATQLLQVTREDTPVRIDVSERSAATTGLLEALRSWDGSRRTRGAAQDLARADELRDLGSLLNQGATHFLAIAVDTIGVEALLDSIGAVIRRADVVTQATASGVAGGDVWEDFLARPSDYFALLAELGFVTEDTKKAHGDLPDDVIEAVRAQELLTDHVKASLRGYQSFAARFVLAQDKVIIGDEMGLGKTVEALAVLAHLRSKGEHHFLVICPAAVVSNWVRETHRHTTLRAYRVHGHPTDRRIALRNWAASGGVAVTTYDLLEWSGRQRVDIAGLVNCVVVDEAHYVKNPATKRARFTADAITAAPRAILMSGTPLENRVEEFRNLVEYVRPDLALAASEISAVRFRRQVAPVYLRRNQEDVLTELPELVEVDEWLDMSAADERRYRAAVVDGNFAAMRRAALLGADSEKLSRLQEIASEAEANGRRVIVFSYFLDVLDLVAAALPGPVFGPVTGRIPAPHRQTIVDEFSASSDGAVLVSQIIAGGVGLNIQAASVVVICEPQLKPTTESQAIARAHRMGQVQSVQVHRLLSEGCVDERVREILARKRVIFDEFARVSDTADAAPEAVDISEAAIAKAVVTAERLRILGRDASMLGAGQEPGGE